MKSDTAYNQSPRAAEISILFTDTEDFNLKLIRRDIDAHYILVKGTN